MRCRRSWMPASGCGTGCCSPCFMTPGCGSARRSGSGTKTSPPPSARSRSFPRHNANGARTKSANTRTIPVTAELVRLYADYLHEEYGDLDSDYVFVNLWGRPRGRPLAYPAVYDLVCRLRARPASISTRTGIGTPCHAPLRDGVPVEVVSAVLGHASITTTLEVYGHLTSEDARRVLEAAGWLPGGRCRGDRHASHPVLARAGAARQAHVDGPAGVPGRRVRLRPGRPSVRRSSLPGSQLPADRPRRLGAMCSSS